MRERAFFMASYCCQGCGYEHYQDGTQSTCLTIHHPDRDTPNPHARLTVLCAACHLAVERIARKRQADRAERKGP